MPGKSAHLSGTRCYTLRVDSWPRKGQSRSPWLLMSDIYIGCGQGVNSRSGDEAGQESHEDDCGGELHSC